jgi:FKBP-type peptidyl-prolyl cis-trans isomerase
MKKLNLKIVFYLLGIILLLVSCHPEKRMEIEENNLIQRYLASLMDTVYVLKPNGSYYYNIYEGFGRMPVPKDTVQIRFEARYLDGAIYISNLYDSLDYPFIVGNGLTMQCLDEGVRYMREGGIAKFVTPSYLIYGRSGLFGYLPAYTPLVWWTNLTRVRPGTKK